LNAQHVCLLHQAVKFCFFQRTVEFDVLCYGCSSGCLSCDHQALSESHQVIVIGSRDYHHWILASHVAIPVFRFETCSCPKSPNGEYVNKACRVRLFSSERSAQPFATSGIDVAIRSPRCDNAADERSPTGVSTSSLIHAMCTMLAGR
jgi:hypothetical protein